MSEVSGSIACKHGQLARVCEVCELERELATANATIESLQAERMQREHAINQPGPFYDEAMQSREALWTPKEAKRLLVLRDWLALDSNLPADNEASNQLYWLVCDRAADPFHPWLEVEAAAALQQTPGG